MRSVPRRPFIFEPLENRRLASATPVGLSATYFNSFDLTQPVVTRVDPVVRFSYGRKAPVGIPGDVFSAEWTGELTPRKTGTYVLAVKADDGVQLSVDGTMVINTWNQTGRAVSRVRLTLTGDDAHNIVLDYHHAGGKGYVALLWSHKGQAAAVIGAKALSPETETVGSALPPATTSAPVSATPPFTTAPTIPSTVTPPTNPTEPGTSTGSPPSDGGTTDNGDTVDTAPTSAPVVSTPPAPTIPTGTGNIWTVDPAGPISTIAQAAALAQPGDTVVIDPGTYHESIQLTTSGTATEPITFIAKTPGTAIIDATGLPYAISSNYNNTFYINLIGLTIQNCDNPDASQIAAVTTGNGWNLQNDTVTAAQGTGIDVWGSNVTLENVSANYCGRAGLSGHNCSNVLVQDCTTIGNNTNGNDPDDDGGAGKWMWTDHVTINGLVSHDNTGPGLWFDTDNTNFTIENCTIYNNHGLTHDYSGSGIRCEVNLGPALIQNNTFYNNTGPSLEVDSCRNFVIENNSFTGSSLTLKDWPRGDAYTLQNITIEYNQFNKTNIATEADNWDDNSPVTKQITMNYDNYITTSSEYLVQWGDQLLTTLAQVQSTLGLELNGTWSMAA